MKVAGWIIWSSVGVIKTRKKAEIRFYQKFFCNEYNGLKILLVSKEFLCYSERYYYKEREKKVMQKQLTAIIEKEDDGYVSLCPEYDIASQGSTVEEARKNLHEALQLFFETASPQEIRSRFHGEIYITRMDVAFG